jgi:uncharacterized protein YecT (DUF1311 family)
VRRYFVDFLSAALLAASVGLPLNAWAADPYAYKMKMTPAEGPVDPAISTRYTAAFSDCQLQKPTGSQNDDCFSAEISRQDTKLNQAWKAALRRLPASTHAPLLAAQRKWITQREPFCFTREDNDPNGLIAPHTYENCRVELTIRRTIWLEKLR